MIDTHKGIIAWFARNHVAANLMMLLIIGCGLISAYTIRKQVNPDMEAQSVTINVPFPGASPGEVETGVILRVEEAVRDIEGIERMTSRSGQGSGRVSLTLENDADIQVVMDEVNMAMGRISSMPNQTERFSVSRSYKQMDAVSVQITGDSLTERGMKDLAIKIRDEILVLPNVTKADIQGARAYEISIELEESTLRQYGLTLDSVARAIRLSSLDLSAGSIRTDSGDIMLRTEGQAYSQREFEDIVLLTEMDGTRITLGDIAAVDDGFVEQDFFSLFNGKPSVGISVYAVSDQNQIQISEEVKAYITERSATLPEGIELTAWRDSTEFLNGTLNIMLSNVFFGVLLVMIILGLFLRIQLAFWVMLGMPIAFLGAFALMPSVGASINMFSLFGFILVLGIVVDDAIIIGESVQSHAERDGQNIDNVIRGAKKVAVPATFGVLTTIATFAPLLSVPGSFGAVPAAIGWVVILCLAFSIIESKLILPAHLASMKPLPRHSNNPIRKFQDILAAGLQKVRMEYYKPLLEAALRQRYITAATFLGMLILAVGFAAGPYVRTVMFPNMSMDFVMARVELVEGASPSQMIKVVQEVSDKLQELDSSRPEHERFLVNVSASTSGTTGRIMADVSSNPDLNTEEIANEWRDLVGELAGTQKMEFVGAMRSSGGDGDVGFSLVGPNPDELRGATELLEETLRSYDGVYEINSSGRGSIPEVNLEIRPSAEALGLTLNDLATQVRAAFYGVEAQRIQRGEEEVRVMVRYPKSERESMGNLESMVIRTADGEEVPFSAVAEIEQRTSPASIFREWGQRNVSVGAGIDKGATPPGTIVRDVMTGEFQQKLKEQFPSVRMKLGGASLQESEMIQRMLITAALGLFAIYALMAIPLKSYVQPLIIMGVIPFGMIGAMIGHLIVGIPFSALSLFGIIALAGVVVNDSIIMVDFVNKEVARGVEITEAAKDAGLQRFRAILLTSLTTFFGLLPILMETSITAQIVVPMAVSLGFGILFATVITLILIPCLYVILDDLNLSRFSVTHAPVEPPVQTVSAVD
jgi:multidrug efflux pump subunit AcrB